MPIDAKEKALRLVDRTHAKLNGKKLGDDRLAFYAAVIAAHDAGVSMRVIGARAGISGARVGQIVRDFTIEPA